MTSEVVKINTRQNFKSFVTLILSRLKVQKDNNLPSLLALGSLFSILVYYMCSTGGQIIGQHFSRIYGSTANVDNKDTISMPFTFQNHGFEYVVDMTKM